MSTDRPRLRPGTRVLRRSPGAVQLGLEPGTGVVLEDVDEADLALIASLDGSTSRDGVLARATTAGVAPTRAAELLATLEAVGLVVSTAVTPVGHRPGRVLVDGAGGLPAAVADTLRRSGVSAAVSGGYALGSVEGSATGSFAQTGPDRPVVVVLVRRDAVDAAEGVGLVRAGVAHLPVVVGDDTAVVGPLAVPGEGPCLSCLDRARTDLDPAWPSLLTQLLPLRVDRPRPVDGDGVLGSMSVALAATVVLAHLDGHDDRPGVSWEVRPPWPRVLARRWQAHPLCPCSAGRAARSGELARAGGSGPSTQHAEVSVTMAG